jgi:hypothetical protein
MTAMAESAMDERRGVGRVRTFLRGRITYNNRSSTLDCLVRDLSTTGARLALSDGASLPDGFELSIPHKDVTYRCQLRWRRPDEVGVIFAVPAASTPKPAVPDPSAIDLLLRIRQLEIENERLRRQVAELSERVSEPA